MFESVVGLRAELVLALVTMLEESHRFDVDAGDRRLDDATSAVEDAAYALFEEVYRLRRQRVAAIVENTPPVDELRRERDPVA